MKKRLNYIDNLRWITVSLLVLYHGAMAYNTWGEANYIFLESSAPVASIVAFISPCFMPLMFLLAGVSSYYSLEKRGVSSFLKERLLRLGVPFAFGLLTVSPVLSYIADLTHNSYKGSFFHHYATFFTRFTDLTGYDGGFTMAHLWFIAVLIVISLISCPIIKLTGELDSRRKLTAGILLSLTALITLDFKTAGKPLVTYICVYLLGYFVFSDPQLTQKLTKFSALFTLLFLGFSTANVALFLFIGGHETLNRICNSASFVTGIPALISTGQKRLDFANDFTKHNSKISYVFYILHFPVVVLSQYFLSLANVSSTANFLLTMLIAYPLTCILCLLAEKTKYLRFFFGMKVKA